MTERIVTLIDMDCFYCQVESRDDPSIRGKPSAVVQYRDWKGGGIIAVNYEARAAGVTRSMRGDDAKEKCPDIILVRVPEVRGKADLTKYRNAGKFLYGKEVIQVLLEFGAVVERASIDEAYVDLTNIVDEKMAQNYTPEFLIDQLSNTFVVGFDESDETRRSGLLDWLKQSFEQENSFDNRRLAIGATVVEEMRARIFEKTQFRCSAGIAHNKTMGKFACGIHKPNKQTILPFDKVDLLFRNIKVTKLRGLGGKLGDAVEEDLQCKTLHDLAQLSMKEIRSKFDEKTSSWLYQISRGICNEPVKERDLPKSIGCSKNFRGPEILDTREKVETWMRSLCEEVSERLVADREVNNRQARGIHVSISSDKRGTISRAGPLHSYDVDKLTRQALSLIAKENESPRTGDMITWRPKLKNLMVSASKFEEINHGAATSSITNFFNKKTETITREIPNPDKDLGSFEVIEQIEMADVISGQKDKISSEVGALKTSPKKSFFDAAPPQKQSQDDMSDLSVVAEELVPNLEAFDPSIIEILPKKLQTFVNQRVLMLKNQKKSDESKKKLWSNSSVSDSNEVSEVSEAVSCEKCGKHVSPFDLPEHLDFHMAQDLQRQMRSETKNISTKVDTASVKRKSKDGPSQPQEKRQKNILSFFQKKD